nr:potassium-transporting ATPase subunit F [Arthrobacter bussei]
MTRLLCFRAVTAHPDGPPSRTRRRLPVGREENVRTADLRPSRVCNRHRASHRCPPAGSRRTVKTQSPGVPRARRHLCRGCRSPVRSGRPDRPGGGEAVIVFDLIAVALAIAALGYLVYALVRPERF